VTDDVSEDAAKQMTGEVPIQVPHQVSKTAPQETGEPVAQPAPRTAALLNLAPHPEGGWFRRTWASGIPVTTQAGVRPTATAILYLLPPGEASAWHVVTSDELWVWHGPGRLILSLGGAGEEPATGDKVEQLVLGMGLADDEVPQVLVPAGVWQSAALAEPLEALVTCVVSPGFDFADWRLA